MRNIDHIRKAVCGQWPVPHWEVQWDGSAYIVRWWDGPSREAVENFLTVICSGKMVLFRYFTDHALEALASRIVEGPVRVVSGVVTCESPWPYDMTFDRVVYKRAAITSF